MTQKTEERQMEVQEETQEEEQEGLPSVPETILEQMIVKIDDPVMVDDARGNLVSLGTKAFELYFCKGATMEELFHCVNQVRATGLNPLVPGECYFFKTGDRPMSLFVGYPVYLRKAKEAGLETLSFEFDDDNSPTRCTVTLTIKDREPFTWPTWFDEVAATTRGNELNARWKKAPRQMFIKCAVVNTIRMSLLLADSTLPYTVEEMGDPVADGYRTLTQPQLDAYSEQEGQEVSVGEVSAENHQVDLSAERKRYFKRLKKAGIVFANDEDRRKWQAEQLGDDKASLNSWVATDYMEMGDIISEIRLGKLTGKEEPETTEAEEEEDLQEDIDAGRMSEAAIAEVENHPENYPDADTPPKTQEEQEEEQDGGKDATERPDRGSTDEPFLITNSTKKKLAALILRFEGFPYGKTIRTQKFKQRALEIADANYDDINAMLESDGILVLNALNTELVKSQGEVIDPDPLNQGDENPNNMEIYITKRALRFPSFSAWRQWERENDLPSEAIAKWDPDDVKRGIALLESVTPLAEIPAEQPKMITGEQYGEMETLIGAMPERFHNSLASEAFRDFAGKNMKPRRPWPGIKELTEVEASDIILAMGDTAQDEKNRITELASAQSTAQ